MIEQLNIAIYFSGVGINKNYIFHNFKFHVCLRSSPDILLKIIKLHIYIYIYIYIHFITSHSGNAVFFVQAVFVF